MRRSKTIPELRAEIRASSRLKTQSQVELSSILRVNQATVSRILRGQFRRVSPAVAKVCKYASISCITSRPLGEIDASVDRLARLTRGRTPRERQAIKLIRLAAELLESDLAGPVPALAGAGRDAAP
jgi:transcriptional regulator with XRE-family HTH domain